MINIKPIVLFFLLSFLSAGLANSDNESITLEVLGTIIGDKIYIRKEPSFSSEKVRRVYDRQNVIITGKKGDWFMVKISNYREGYVHKKNIEYKNILKKERPGFDLKKLNYDLRALVNKFNNKVTTSEYFNKSGYKPDINLDVCLFKGKTLTVKLKYNCEFKDDVMLPDNSDNPLQDIMVSLLNIVILKMSLIQADKYIINIYTDYQNDRISEAKEYAIIELDSDKNVPSYNNSSLTIKDANISMNYEELFATCP